MKRSKLKYLAHLMAPVLGAMFLCSCSHTSFKEQNKEELSHYIWSMTLVAPAINAAVGPFSEEGMRAAPYGIPADERNALIHLSNESFHPAKVYGKIHRESVEMGTKEEMVELALLLDSPAWQKFSNNLLKQYGEKGSEEVAQVMRLLDEERYPLDMEKARIAEKLSWDSYNYKVVDILFSKMTMGSPGEAFLYRQSIFVATYLAAKDLSESELKELENVRGSALYQKYKKIFETVVSGQYDFFFQRLKFLGSGA